MKQRYVMTLINIKLVKGGRLIASRWNRDLGKTEEMDATPYMFYHFDDELHLEDGVTFKDLMLLARNHQDMLSPMLTKQKDCLHKILDEGLNKEATGKSCLKYVEVSWRASIDKYGPTVDFHKWISFNGIGDPEEGEHFKGWPEGEPVTYALDFTPTYELAPLPLKLNPHFKLFDERETLANAPVIVEATEAFTLYDVLHGAFWETSFHGEPDARNERLEELNKSIREIESGEAKLIPWEDVKARLEQKVKDIKNES